MKHIQRLSLLTLAAMLVIIDVGAAVHGEDVGTPSVIPSAADRAIAVARAYILRSDRGPMQFRAIAVEQGFQVLVDHAAGYRRIVALSPELKLISIGPKLPLQPQRYTRCCGAR